MERPTADDDSALPPDPGSSSDPEPTPRHPKVTPLDEDKNIEDGIEIKET
jgi:hypothetical protein